MSQTDSITSPLVAHSGLQAAAAIIKQAKSVIVTTHINPDGDAIGSALGLMHILRSMGKKARVVTQDGAGQRYRFLPGAQEINEPSLQDYDLGIAVDCGNISRVGTARSVLDACPLVLRIDHHAVGESFGDIEYLDAQAAAVGEMVAALADEMGAPIGPEAGVCLLASIVEDTGCFQFASVTPRTFQICSELVAAGADLHGVVQQLFWRNPEGAVKLKGHCLESMTVDSEGRLAWALASREDFDRYGAVQEDVDDVVNGLLSVDGVEVAVLLRETDTDYRVSLRSREYVDVAEVAQQFYGGGHRRAAGCRLAKSEVAVRGLLSAIVQRFK